MKKTFSKSWIRSKQPRKQRKYRANAQIHIRKKLLSVNLNKELRKKYGKRNFPLRKGDVVKIMVGEFKKKRGGVTLVDLKKLRVSIEGIQRAKKDGTKFNVWFNPSNLQIQELNLDDKKRVEAIKRGIKKVDSKLVIKKKEKVEEQKKSEKSETKSKDKEDKK
jgi:large subunit ribosomal protein L24